MRVQSNGNKIAISKNFLSYSFEYIVVIIYFRTVKTYTIIWIGRKEVLLLYYDITSVVRGHWN